MQVLWPEKVKSHFRVYHPINSGGTTWLRESDLVFVHNAPWDGLERGKLGDSVTLLEAMRAGHGRALDRAVTNVSGHTRQVIRNPSL